MANTALNKVQLKRLFAPLFERVIDDRNRTSGGDAMGLWGMRGKLAKELTYLERG